jgi:hypothetical protein
MGNAFVHGKINLAPDASSFDLWWVLASNLSRSLFFPMYLKFKYSNRNHMLCRARTIFQLFRAQCWLLFQSAMFLHSMFSSIKQSRRKRSTMKTFWGLSHTREVIKFGGNFFNFFHSFRLACVLNVLKLFSQFAISRLSTLTEAVTFMF